MDAAAMPIGELLPHGPAMTLIDRLCNAWLADHAPNQTIRYDTDFLPLIGHSRFSAAQAAWEKYAGLTPPASLRVVTQ